MQSNKEIKLKAINVDNATIIEELKKSSLKKGNTKKSGSKKSSSKQSGSKKSSSKKSYTKGVSGDKQILQSLYKMIDANDSKKIEILLKSNKSITPAIMQQALEYASLMGEDESVRILFKYGAVYSKKAYDNAFKVTSKQGQGGHTLCALYIKFIGTGAIDPKIPLSKIVMKT